MNKSTKIIALLLALMLCFSAVGSSLIAIAAETDDDIIVDNGDKAEGEEEKDIYADAVGVSNADELEEALAKESTAIRIEADFLIDRTFYVISDTAIFADEAHTLTRATNFGGDVFVVGEYDDGTVCEGTVNLIVGRDDSETDNLLTIDGNRDFMITDVTGTVFFGCANSEITLYTGLTVKNCKKVGNDRTHRESYGLSYPARIGGPVAIVAGGKMLIFGGQYINNSVNDEVESDDLDVALCSTQGGAFYFFGTANIYGGTFKNNHAQRGGAFYAYRTLNIYGATVEGNSSSNMGGAIYMPASGLAVLNFEGQSDFADSGITFKDNTSVSFGGALYCSGKSVNIDSATFSGNTAGSHGGAIYCSIEGDESTGAKLTLTNAAFEGNKTDFNGGAVYVQGSSTYMENVTFKGNHSYATANASGSRYGGGAIYSTGSYVEINGGSFENNTSDNYGAGIEAHSSSKVVLNKITTAGNSAASNGGFIYTNNAEVEIYNSAIRTNKSGNQGGAAFITGTSTIKAYLTTFEGNYSVNSGGALLIYTGTEDSLLHSCVFLDNTSDNYGGAIYISKASTLNAYNTSAKGNSAFRGGFLYETTTGTVVTLNGLSVSGNTASDGGPIIWGNSTGAKLYINKTTYIDVDYSDVLDDAYWASAIVNKLTVSETTDEVPGFINYGESEITDPEDIINPNITNAVELQTALSAGLKEITIISDFQVNRTFYINSDTTIYATGNRTLTRAPGFGGDIFIVGEAADGTACEEEITVTFSPSGEGNSLTIDGNKDNMTTDVTGTVFFVCNGAHLVLRDAITVKNCHKVGNERTMLEAYGLSYPHRIGGPVVINAKSTLSIYGGEYKNNSVCDEGDDNPDWNSTQGGVIYSFGNTNIYGGTFEGNHAARGGFLYNYRKTNIHNASIIGNSASSLGGAVYMAASTACYLYVGGSTNICDSYVLFEGNTSEGNGGAILSQGALTHIQNTDFVNNKSGMHGGAVCASTSDLNKEKINLRIENSSFSGGSANNNAGAVYLNKAAAEFINVDFENNHASATENSSGSRYGGGAIYTTGAYALFEGVRFKGNSSDYNGGAAMFNSASEAVLYNVTAEGNTASAAGGFIYSKSTIDIYNSTIKNNTSTSGGGGVVLQDGAVTNIYSTTFDGNKTASNGGALMVYTNGNQTTINNCQIKNNSADTYGGGLYVSGVSLLDIYNTVAENNSANRGGFLYETVTGTIVTLSEIAVSGNTALDGGPIIWGNSTGAKLYINKTNFKDTETSTLDSAYWSAAIVNKLKVYEITTAAPECDEYGNEDYSNFKDYVSVSNSAELEAAINSGAENIRIISDFTLDRTFYITKAVTIFSTSPYRLTRAEDFAGDIFVIGEDKNGKSQLLFGGNNAVLTLGNPISATENLLTIDGNKNKVTCSVSGSILFLCNSAKVNIYDNISIVNARKVSNERTGYERFSINYAHRLGGAMAIVESGSLNIYGGNFKGNTVNDEIISTELGEDGRNSTLGGAIYNRGGLNIYGGNFEYCYSPRGGVIYNYAIMHIYGGNFVNNYSAYGGVAYSPSSASVANYIGGESGNTTVTFDSNSSVYNGGAIFSGTLAATVVYGDTLFKNNVSQKSNGGAIYGGGVVLVYNTTFTGNTAKSKGGAIYLTRGSNDSPVQEPVISGCTFTKNIAANGGAVAAYASGLSIEEGTNVTIENSSFKNNEATASGGAILIGYRATVNLLNSTLENNTSTAEGGAIYMIYEGVLNAEGSSFSGNIAGNEEKGYGGAISAHSAIINGNDLTFTENTAGLRGGAIYVSYNSASLMDSTVNISDSSFSKNVSLLNGGAIYATDRKVSYGVDENGDPLPGEDNGTMNLILQNVDITENTATEKGGAVYLSSYTHTFMGNVKLNDNRITVDGSGHNAGAIYTNAYAALEINGAEINNNYSGANGGAIGMYSNSSAVLNNVTATGNSAVGDGGFAHCDTAYITLYGSNISQNTAGSQGGAISLIDLSTISAYSTEFTGNTSAIEGGAIFAYAGASRSVLHSCTFTENESGTLGGAIYVSNHSLLDIYNATAIRNHANKGGFIYETTYDTVLTLNGATVTGNTDNMGGPIIWGNTLNADLYINKANFVDTEAEVLDDAYWAGAIYNLLTVFEISDPIPELPTYVQEYTPPTEPTPIVHPEVKVEHIFSLAEKADHGVISGVYGTLPRLDNSSNFMSKNTTLIPNINGQDVTVDSFIYHKDNPAGNGNFGEGILIYQAMCYKRANPQEDVSISISAYRFSAHTAICLDRNSPYFGYMRALHDQDYDKYGFVRISYLLLCAARMGIDVTVIGQLDGYPNSATSPLYEPYFTEMLDAPCDSTYVTDGVIGDYMTFRACKWAVDAKGGADMMHTKLCAVSHYIDMNGEVHRNAVWTSSSNLDGINYNGTNGLNQLQTATIVSDHAEIFRVSKNYLDFLADYCGQEEVYIFRDLMISRIAKQIDMINSGREQEIPADEQIVYLGSENDKFFELYFSPFGGDVSNWDEANNPFTKQVREMHNSEGPITFIWNNVRWGEYPLRNQLESVIIDSFHKIKSPENKIYVNLPGFDSAAFGDLSVGTDIGFKAFNQNDFGHVHSKDMHLSYVKDGQRYYVSVLNSMNVHSGSMAYQSNFALVIKETNCNEDSVFFTFADETTVGIAEHEYSDEILEYIPDDIHEDGYTYHPCANCDERLIIDTIHRQSDWQIIRAATPEQNGIAHRSCLACSQLVDVREFVYPGEESVISLENTIGQTFSTTKSLQSALDVESTPMTLEATLQLGKNVADRGGVIVGNYSEKSKNRMNLEVYTFGRVRLFFTKEGQNFEHIFNTDIRSDEAVNLAVTIEGTVAKLYLNSVLKETATLADTVPEIEGRMFIGGDMRGGNYQYFRGTIYSVHLFDHARNDEELKRDMVAVFPDGYGVLATRNFTNTAVLENVGTAFTADSAHEIGTLSTSPKTIEATVNMSANFTGRAGVIVGNYKEGCDSVLNLEVNNNGRLRLYTLAEDKTPIDCIFTPDIRGMGKVHIALTIDGNKVTLYLNGEATDTKTLGKTPAGSTDSFMVGGDNRNGNTQFFKGYISNVNIFADVRTADEIIADMTSVATDENLLYSHTFTSVDADAPLDTVRPAGTTFTADSDVATELAGSPNTIEATIKLDKALATRGGVIVGNYSDTAKNVISLEAYNYGKLRIYLANNGKTASHVFASDIRSDSAVHIAVTFEGTTAKLYLNSVLAETATLAVAPPQNITSLKIGGDYRGGNSQYFKGKIYSVGLFEDARSAEEISADALSINPKAEGLMYSRYFAEVIDNSNQNLGTEFTADSSISLDTLAGAPKTLEATVSLPKVYHNRGGVIVGNYEDLSLGSMGLEIYYSGRVRLYYAIEKKSPVDCIFDTDIRGDEPTHIAVTIEDLSANLYINGVLTETKALRIAPPEETEGFRVGGDNRIGNTQYFKGTIYNVNLFDDARTADEIKADMKSVSAEAEGLLYSKVFKTEKPATPTEVIPRGETFSVQTPYIIGRDLDSTPLTFEAIVNLCEGFEGRGGVILGNFDGKKENQLNIEIYSEGRPRLYYTAEDGSYVDCIFDSDIRGNNPTHIAIKVDGLTATLYINGIETEQKALAFEIPEITGGFKIGSDNRSGNDQYFKGTIYGINLFSNARSAEQIAGDVFAVDTSDATLLYSAIFAADACEQNGHTLETIIYGDEESELGQIRYDRCTVCGKTIECRTTPQITDIIEHRVFANASALRPAESKSGIALSTLFATPHTIEALIQLDKSYNQRAGVIFGNYDGSLNNQLNLEIYTGGRPRLYYSIGSKTYSYIFNTDIRSDSLTHIAVTIEGLSASLYVNGTLRETIALTVELPEVTEGFRIGHDNRTGTQQYFAGTIYSVALLEGTRTAEQIAVDRYLCPSDSEGIIYNESFLVND